MRYIVAFAQVLSLVCLVALAFPQNGSSNRVSSNNNSDNPTTSTTQRTTTACPCIATAEYNPVCGNDNVTYWNMGRFNCAKNCNPNLEVRLIRACEPYSQLSSN
uniref:Kazal n=1 Tax=Odontomachus monticola TaxID=613454 RepID=A0A348G5Y2_ODOMO